MDFVTTVFKNKSRIAAIDVGTSSTKVVVMEKKSGGDSGQPEFTLEYEILEADLFAALSTGKSNAMRESIKKAFERLEITHNVPIHLIVSKDLSMSTEHEFCGSGDERLQKISCFKVPFQLEGKNTSGESNDNVIFIPKRHIFALFRFFKSCGITIASVNPGPLVLSESIIYALHEDERYDRIAIIDIGASQTTCCARSNDKLISIGMFNKGGNELTKLIADQLKIKLSDAEHVKRAEYERTLSVMNNVLAEFLRDIKKYLSYLKDSKNFIPSKIFVTGGTAKLTGIVYYLEDILGVPIQLWGIRGKITLKKKLYGKRRFIYDEPILAVTMGIYVDTSRKIKDFSISRFARTFYNAWKIFKVMFMVSILLFSIYGIGIYVENLGIVKDYINTYQESKRVERAKEQNLFLQLDGINYSPTGSVVLINNALFKVGDMVRPGVLLKEIQKEAVILQVRGKDVHLRPANYYIIDYSILVLEEGTEQPTLFSIITEKIKNAF